MIKKIKENWFAATKDDLCGDDILFIRMDPNELWHICRRKPGMDGEEFYLCGKVRFDTTLGTYYCSRPNCYKKLELIDVWSDLALTGYEGRA